MSDRRACKRVSQGNVRKQQGVPVRRPGVVLEVGCCTPPRSIFYNMAEGVAGRLEVAYRRHADVRRSADDWSIATRRFSLRKLHVPFSLPRTSRHSHACNLRFSYERVCARPHVSVCRSSTNSPTRPSVSPLLGETLLAVVAYHPSS